MVYESLLLWPAAWASLTFAILFFFIALINVVFTSFVAYEQISMLYREFWYKEESMRVERFLKIKDRFWQSQVTADLNIELDFYGATTKWPRVLIISGLITLNALLGMLAGSFTMVVLTVVGALSSPIVLFFLPGYLFFDYLRRHDVHTTWHRKGSAAFAILGFVLGLTMSTISVYIIRDEIVLDNTPSGE